MLIQDDIINRFVNRYFIRHETMRFDWKLPITKGWYKIPFWINKYNRKNCKYNIPDWMEGTGTKVKPFLGLVLMLECGDMCNWKWWKHLKKYKVDPKTLELEEEIKNNE